MTLREAQTAIREIDPSFSIRRFNGEYAVIYGAGKGTYYTDDLEDAIQTAQEMKRQQNQ